ncbi:hypothetical protein ACIRYZ_34175 [Kitasatospora sp. NPDC101155]|uniref:hypothetical protein n=1 Tax=Kitasatospora sp. NPDC101155 TaxID=3364097 RepID=UPI00383068A0
MSDAVPQYGFTQARRGYAPEQVDRALVALTAQRDEAWERLSVLGAGIRQMETRLAEVRRAADEAPEPDYQVLSEQAAGLAEMARNEARAVKEKAERFAEDLRDEVYEAGQALDKAAKEYSATTRTEADAAARRTEERTRAEAEGIRAEADRESRSARDSATAYAAKVRVAAAETSEHAEAELAAKRRKADETFAEAQAKADAEDAEVSETAERRVKEAEQYRETVLNQIKQLETDAQAKADQLIEQARRDAEKTNAESEREQRAFDTRLETVQKHLDHIKATLASLTGAAVGQIEPLEEAVEDGDPADEVADAVPVDSEADTGEVPLPNLRKASVMAPAPDPAPAPVPAPAQAPEKSAVVLRQPVVGGPAAGARADAAKAEGTGVDAAGPVVTGPVVPAAVPPKPAASPEAVADRDGAQGGEGAGESEDETRIVPKIIIVDDGSGYEAPNTVAYRRR